MEIKEAVSGDGNIRPFGSGTAGDVSRRLYGSAGGGILLWDPLTKSGVFNKSNYAGGYSSGDTMQYRMGLVFDSDGIVPTGPENASRTSSVNFWRRVPE